MGTSGSEGGRRKPPHTGAGAGGRPYLAVIHGMGVTIEPIPGGYTFRYPDGTLIGTTYYATH